jgi:molecular chaperone GrpE
MSAKIEISAAGPQERKEQEQPAFQVVDRRHFLNLEEIDKAVTGQEKPRYPSYVEELIGRMAETERRFEEKKSQIETEISRTKARLEADYARRVELDKQTILLPFLDVLDNLERALAAAPKSEDPGSLRHGVEMITDLFRARLQALGVEPMAVLNQPFDPNLGQAVGVVEVTEAEHDGLVKEEVLRGYRLGEHVLRPAQVLVGKHS